MNNAILQAALTYTRANIPVFPCKPDKVPYIKGGFKAATTDVQQIHAWWTAWPDAMIGFPTGKVTGLWVLDVDLPKKEGDADGRMSLQRLTAVHGLLPLTRIQQTPGGGTHYIFLYPQDGEGIRNSVSGVAPKIDVRGDGGYIIIAPSINGEGQAYSFLNQAPPVHAPEWILTLVRQPLKLPSKNINQPDSSAPTAIMSGLSIIDPYIQKALDEECAKIAGAQQGVRNDTLNKASFAFGTLVGGGELDEGMARSRLLGAALKCGLPDDEAVRTIDSGITAGKQNPRSIPALPPATSQVSEESIASAFTSRHAENLRFVKELGCWLEWHPNKHIWEQDKTNRAFDYARRECKALNPNNKPSLGKSTTAQGVERFARADPCHATTEDQWDQHPFLLGTPSGAINLKL